MKILVLNCGSSSIKCSLFCIDFLPKSFIQPLWQGQVQWKNDFVAPLLSTKSERGEQYCETLQVENSSQAIKEMINSLFYGKTAVLSSEKDVNVIGHRIVHGGEFFSSSVRITPQVKEKIRFLSELAPLHNPPALEGIEIFEKIFADTPHIAVFDTAFHRTIPLSSRLYPGPYRWYEEDRIQRYGFHGISYQYCARRSAEILGTELNNQKTVICHLEAGASLCAVEDGKSIDTTM